MVHAIRMTHAVNEGVQGVEIAWAMRDLEAVIGAPRRALVGHGRPPGPSDLSGDQWVRIGMPLGRGQLTGAVNGDPPGALACVRPPLGAVEVAGAARLGRKLFLARLGVGHVREAAEAMPLKTTRPCRSGELRPCRVKRLAAVIQGQPRGATTGDEAGGLLQRSERRMALCRPHRGRINVRAVLPLGSRLRVSIVARGQRREAFLTLLERATPGRGRAGAAVEEWSHQASREGTSPDHTPSHPGTKHLVYWYTTRSGQRHTPGGNDFPGIAPGEVHTGRILELGSYGRRCWVIKGVIGVEEEVIRGRLHFELRQLRFEL
jgi:hypothetical protein